MVNAQADSAKRAGDLFRARLFYTLASHYDPVALLPWVENAKLEDEAGSVQRCQSMLAQGLLLCPNREPLVIKALKLQERLGVLGPARSLLAGVVAHARTTGAVDKMWKMLAEGVALEGRAGREFVARRLWAELLQAAPTCGPLIHEAVRFEGTRVTPPPSLTQRF